MMRKYQARYLLILTKAPAVNPEEKAILLHSQYTNVTHGQGKRGSQSTNRDIA